MSSSLGETNVEIKVAVEDPTAETLSYFRFEHLPAPLQVVSQPFHEMANDLVADLPNNRQRQLALEYLLIAKDCAVRSMVHLFRKVG